MAPSAYTSVSPHEAQANNNERNDEPEELESVVGFDFGAATSGAAGCIEFGKDGSDSLDECQL